MNRIIEIYVDLPEEATPTLCKTTAQVMDNGLYKILPTDNYDPEDEVWEFLPGSIVKAEFVDNGDLKILLATEEI